MPFVPRSASVALAGDQEDLWGASCGEGLIGSDHVVVGESRIPSLEQGSKCAVERRVRV